MPLFRFTFRAMAAENELQLAAADAATARRAADLAIADVQRIEAKYSRYRDDTITTRINKAAGGEPVALDAETAALLALRRPMPSLERRPLRRHVGRAAPRVGLEAQAAAVARSRRARRRLVALVDWSSVEWSDAAIRLPRAGMEIDFGGIGKEYAADRAATICLEARHPARRWSTWPATCARVGPQESGAPWRVGIRHPRREGQRDRVRRTHRRRRRHQRRLRAVLRDRRAGATATSSIRAPACR